MRAGLVTVYAHTVFPLGVQTGSPALALTVYYMVFMRFDRHLGQRRNLAVLHNVTINVTIIERIAFGQQIGCGDISGSNLDRARMRRASGS